MAQTQKYTIKYYDIQLFWETSEVVSNETYDIEEECKQRYYTYNTGKKSYTKPEKRNKVYSEEEKEEIHKENKMKVKQLAKYSKLEEYNIIGIVETNIEEQKGKWINTKEYRFSSFWTEPEKEKYKGSGIRLLVDQNWLRNMGICKKFSPYL